MQVYKKSQVVDHWSKTYNKEILKSGEFSISSSVQN